MTNLAKWLVKVIVIWTITLTCVVIVSSVVSLNTNIGIITRITQAQIKDINAQIQNGKEVKPSYEELKSHSVVILGCADSEIEQPEESKYSYPLEKNGVCWLGSGSVIKVTKESTYILTNNHVVGFWTVNPIIYVENGEQKIQAEIVKNHPLLDMAVIKINGILKDKVAVPGYSTVSITDKVYVVGHPLGNKFVYTDGLMAGYVGNDELFQLPCIFGNSGSGIFDKDGNLVSLVYALQGYPGFFGIPMAQITHTLGVAGNDVQKFLKELGLYNEKE
jgi:S1-C subfamily serine protease